MKTNLLLLVIGCMTFYCCAAAPVDTEEAAMAYLNKYGYLNDGDMDGGMPRTDLIKRKAIEFFQRFINITMTGTLDNATYSMMNLPRCGMKDMESDGDMMRKKRYALGTRWYKTDLTYRIDGRTPDLPAADVDRIMDAALKAWSDVSTLTFRRVSAGQQADILINFYNGAHGDGNAFDGPSGVLAHAYFPTSDPIGGDAHFDEAETYSDGSYRGTNLFQVAAHEFGHSLGLRHSQVEDALMFPYYRGYVPNFQLHSDDIAGIQAQYGPDVGQPEEMETPSTPVGDCTTVIKVATRTSDGSTYFFTDTQVYRIIRNVIQANYPRRIGEEFPGLPDNLDAAFFYPRNGRTYFFKGSQYWQVRNQAVEAGFPRSISEWRGLPSDLSAAFIWSGNGQIYFIKGDQYYRYTPGSGVDQSYPQPLTAWRGLPSTIDAAFQYSNSRTYFFSGTDYYRFNDRRVQVDSGYPASAPEIWLGCNAGQLEQDPGNDARVTSTPRQITVVVCIAVSLLRYF